MSSLAISGTMFACILVGIVFGAILRAVLHERHLTDEAKEIVKLGMGLVATLTALVLGLMVASAKSSFDNQRNGLSHMAGDLIFLDRVLAHYGPETKEIREQLRASVADMLQRTWPNEGLELGRHRTMAHTEGKYEGIYEKIQELSPKNDAQRSLQAQALKTASDIAQSRWELFAQKGSSIPLAFLVVL